MPDTKPAELESCPNPECKGNQSHVVVDHSYGVWWVDCIWCAMAGPEAFTVAEATRLWNLLPRTITWCKEPPGNPGLWNRYIDTHLDSQYDYTVILVDASMLPMEDDGAWWIGPMPEMEDG